MDKITDMDKHVVGASVTYHIRTESGDRYQVIQFVKESYVSESIYYIAKSGRTALVRKITFGIKEIPKPNFQEFIEAGDASMSH